MITNSSLLELRATGLSCQKSVLQGNDTFLEKQYATLFQLVIDGLPMDSGERESGKSNGPYLNLLLGK